MTTHVVEEQYKFIPDKGCVHSRGRKCVDCPFPECLYVSHPVDTGARRAKSASNFWKQIELNEAD